MEQAGGQIKTQIKVEKSFKERISPQGLRVCFYSDSVCADS